MNRSEFGSPALFDYIKHRLLAKPLKSAVRQAKFGGITFTLEGDELYFDIPLYLWDTDILAKDLSLAQQSEAKKFDDTRY